MLRSRAAWVVAYRNLEGVADLPVLVAHPTLVYVRRGIKQLRVPGEPIQVVQAGEVVLLPVGFRYMSEVIPEHGAYESTVIAFDADYLVRTIPASSYNSEAWTEGCLVDPLPSIQTLVRDVSEAVEGSLGRRIVKLRLEEIVLRLIHESVRGCRILVDGVRFGVEHEGRLRETMERHFRSPLGLEEFAALSGRSLSKFKRDFRASYGISPGRWLRTRRLGLAADLLQGSDISVTDACAECGFGNLSHFVQAFARHHGVTPKQWQLASRSAGVER